MRLPAVLKLRSATVEQVLLIGGAFLLSAFAGLAIGMGHGGGLAAALLAGCALLCLLGLTFRAPLSVPYVLVSGGVLVIAANALRLTSTLTVSDALIVAAAPLLAGAALAGRRLPTIPVWLLVGAGLICTSALVVYAFPPSALNEAIFQAKNLATGESVTSSSLELAGQLLVAVCVVPTIIALTITTWQRARLLINLWMLGTAASCAVALLAAFANIDLEGVLTGHHYALQFFHGELGRWSGLAVHPVQLGLTAAMPVPVALSRMASRGALKYGLLVALYSLAALVSGSRSAVIGLLVAFILVFAWQARARTRIILVGLFGFALIYLNTGISSSSALQRLFGASTTATTSDSGSDARRIDSYAEAIHAFFARPLTGYGFQGLRGAHNLVLELLSSGGMLLLVGYAIIIGGALRLVWTIRLRLPTDLGTDAVAMAVALIVFLTVSMVENTSFDRYTYFPIAVILGLAFALQHEGGYVEEATARSDPDRYALSPAPVA